MARISDLLSDNSISLDRAFASQCFAQTYANILRLSVDDAACLYAECGTDCIYAVGGSVMPDSERNRQRMLRVWGRIVIVLKNGKSMIWHKSYIDSERKKAAERKTRAASKASAKRRDASCNRRERENIFKECQGVPCPKHQGQGRSLDMLGQYNSSPQFYGKLECKIGTIAYNRMLNRRANRPDLFISSL